MNRRDLLIGASALAACARAETPAPAPAPFPMRRGVNLGNALEAPNEGDWGYRIELDHLNAIRDAGFDGVRLPVRFDAHAGAAPPYAFGGDFWRRIDEIVDHGLGLGLKVQVDMHHYERLIAEPQRQRARFLGMWAVIAHHFQGAPDSLMFEPFNEPHGDYWTGRRLRALQAEVLDVIRRRDRNRLVVFGPPRWNSIDALGDWRPPAGDRIAVSVHYYEPYAFTHQNAEWLGAEAPHYDRAWGTEADVRAVQTHIERAARWAREQGVAIQLGEFGANRSVSLAQRPLWTRIVREACEVHGIGWCVWDFAGAFPVWDRERGAWIEEMRAALLGEDDH